MNALPFPIFLAAVALIVPVRALEAPADNAPPPPAVKPAATDLPEIKLPPAPDKAVAKPDVAFLGVISGD